MQPNRWPTLCVFTAFGRAFGENAVALRIGVGAEAEEDFAGVVHVHVVIHHHELFGEHHLTHAPEAVRFSKATAPEKSGGKGMLWIAH